MTGGTDRATVALDRSPTLAVILLVVVAFFYLSSLGLYLGVMGEGDRRADFNVFHAAGHVAWEGRLVDAYRAGTLMADNVMGVSGDYAPILFTYPPQFGFVVLPLGALDRALAFGLFAGASLALYLHALARLAGEYLAGVLLAALPVVAANLLNGQTGLLLGAFAGLYMLVAARDRRVAGLPAGLMVLKPHLALGFAAEALARRQWGTVAIAAATVVGSSLLAAAVFGADVWPAFLQSAGAAGDRLEGGGFKLYRMTSVYALSVTLGLSQAAAVAMHLAVLAAAMILLVRVATRAATPRVPLALAAIVTLAVSPYVYEYDMTILFAGLALVWRDMAARSRPWERGALIIMSWATAWRVLDGLIVLPGGAAATESPASDALAVQAVGYLGVAILATAILLRPAARVAA